MLACRDDEILRGKTAPITGSLGGIGFATAKALAVKATYHGPDLRHPAEIAEMVAMAAPDIVVNNAVVRYFGAVEKFAPDHWDEALAVEVARTLSSPAANRPAGS